MEYLDGDACLFFVDEEQMEDVQAYLEINDTLTFEFSKVTQEFFYLEIPYEKGVIETSEDAFAASIKEVM